MNLVNRSRLLCLICIVLIAIGGCSENKSKAVLESQLKQASAAEKVINAELGKPRSLSPIFMCYNVNSTQVANWQNKSFINAVNNLSPSTLRIPGGDIGNYWNWQRGGLIENTASLPNGLPFFLRFKARQYTASKLTDFQTGLAATNTKPIFVLNMLTSELEFQLAMLRKAKDLGMEVKYIELGNEFYFNIPNYKKTFPNPRAYGLIAKKWTEAIIQEFPNVKIAVVGVVPPLKKPPRLQNWNKVMRGTVLPNVDAITLHIYNGHGLENRVKQQNNYPYFKSEDVSIILGEPFRNWQLLRADSNYKAIPSDKQIWITEYNLFEDIFQQVSDKPTPRVAGSWTHGLYNLATSLLFVEESRIESICNHSLSESSIFGAILNDSDSFVNPANRNMRVAPMTLSATGEALSLLGEATQNMTNATPIKFETAQLKGKNNFNYPAVYGWQFNNDTEKKAILLNLSSQAREINLSSLFSFPKYQQLSASPQALVKDSTTISKTIGDIKETVTLAPYSVTKVN